MSADGILMVSSELLFRAEDRIAELEAQLRQEREAASQMRLLLRESIRNNDPDWDFSAWHDRVCDALKDKPPSDIQPDNEGLRVRKR